MGERACFASVRAHGLDLAIELGRYPYENVRRERGAVARERLDTVERLLEEKNILTVSEIDHYQPSEEVDAIRAQHRAQFIETLLRVIEADFEEITRPDMPGSREEILKSLT